MRNIILIPTYNERDNIVGIVRDIRSRVGDTDIMVVDDGSPDGTADTVKDMMKTDPRLSILERKSKEGLGAAYKDALDRTRLMSDVSKIVTMDADGSHDPRYLPAMLEKAKNVDLVIGSRYVDGGGVENWHWYREALSRAGNIYCGLILNLKIRDLTAGFVCFDRKLLESIDFSRFHSSGYAYQIEFKHYLAKAGFSWAEVPIIFRERRKGRSKISFGIVLGGLLIPLRLLFPDIFRR